MTSEAALIYYWHLRCDKGNVAQNKKWVANGIFWSPMYWGFIVNAANSSTIFTFRLLSSHSTTSSISSTLWCFNPYKPYIFIQTIWPPQSPRPPWPPWQLDHGETPEVWQKNINQHHSASISINQHYSALISNNQYQSASIRINQHQYTISMNWYKSGSIRINQNQSASISINQNQSESIRINQHQSELISINKNQSA